MSETLRDLVVSLSLQTDNFTRNIKSVSKQIADAESQFKLAAAGVEGFERTATGLSTQLSTLERRLSLQKDAVNQYQRALEAANNKLSECYNRQNDYAQRLENAKAAQQALKEQVAAAAQQVRTFSATLGDSDSATIAAKANLDALKGEYRASVQEVKKLSGQNEALKKTTQNAADAVSQANTNFNMARAGVKQTEAEISRCNQSLRLAQTNWDAAGKSIDASRAAITTFGKEIGLAESRFKLATAGIKDMDTSVAGLTAKLTLLREKLNIQEKSIAEYENALRGAREQLQAAQQAHDPEKIQQASDAVLDAEAALNRAKAAVKATRAEIEEANRQLATAKSAWTAAGKSLESFGKTCDSVSKAMTTAGRTLTTVMTTPILTLGMAAVKASLDFESSFAGVRKTVDATETEFASLAASSKQMSTEIAASTSEINGVMATGGQLGIANEHLTDFTRVMIDLGNSCEDLNADEAATSIAKFANVMGTNQSLFQNIGSTIVDLGNNFATTEKPIMEMAQRLAGAGKQVGLTEAQVLGFATALSSVGIEAQMGGSAFSKALIKMEVASATGGDALKDFATVCGMTSSQFKTLFDSDPAAAFQAFIVGLSKMDEEGESAIAVLDEIGIKEVRLRDTMLRATNATELFSRAQETANRAWEENTALATEANKRYATTESKLVNLKNKAVLFGQQLGDDLNPTIQNLIKGADDMLDSFLKLDAAQRKQILQYAAIAAAAGPVLLTLGTITKGVGTLSTGIGKFATAVGKAGGGIKGFMTVLSSSPAVWLAVAAAAITATVAIADYVSGAKQAREALKGMQESADKWKSTAAETFYGKSEGLSFFGMSKSDFVRDKQTAQDWLNGLITVWTDGKKESEEIVSEWTDSFKALTESTRTELMQLKETADEGGYTSVSRGLSDDIAALDAMDAEIARLLKKRQNGYFTEKDKIRLQELIDTREAIEVKYRLSPADADGFDTIRQKLEAEVARAQARGKQDADVTVYENAVVAAAQGLAAMNSEIDAQYDKEFALIQLIVDSAERQAAMDALNARYNENRRAAAQEYAALLADIVMPVWEQENIQQAASDVDLLTQKLREYSAANETEKPALLEDLNAIAAAMDEGAMTEYIAILTQIQSLLDSGMSETEVQAMFPEIDFSTALEQIASIQAFLNNREVELPGLNAMFGDALPEEVLTIATDLDMTGAQERWAEFAENPGAITTDAVIAAYSEAENVEKLQPQVDAFIAKYTEIPEGADKAELTPEGLIAYVSTYAEATNGTDVSGLTPENITAMVSAYKELASGTDVTTLKPSEITAYISKYLEENKVDTTGLTPAGITAFVMAYQEITGGALTTSLTPDDITAMVAKYLEAENVDISALSPDQIEAIVTAYAEATGVDKSTLLQNFTAYITRYDDTNAVKPKLNMTVGIYGYDLMAYRKFIKENPVEVQGIVKLGEIYQNPSDALLDPQTKFWQDGQEIPVEAVPTELLTADKVAVLDADGTLHVLIAPKITGTQEAIDALSPLIDEVDQFGTTTLGIMTGMIPTTTMDLIGSAVSRINSYTQSLDYNGWDRFWASLRGESVDQGVLNQSMRDSFPAANSMPCNQSWQSNSLRYGADCIKMTVDFFGAKRDIWLRKEAKAMEKNNQEKARVVHQVKPIPAASPRRERVAAYCRVSSGKDAMLHSLSAQVSHYSTYIQKHPGWEYAGVYADEAYTGTKDTRPQFQCLLEECRAKRIDRILTKSVSRFARNTVTLLETVRELRALGVAVYFEEQNIDSLSEDGELMLTILASFAQAESKSVSDNCKWRIRKDFSEGKPVNLSLIHGYRQENGKIEIDADEAAVVRRVFSEYLQGKGTLQIANLLQREGIPRRFGGQWCASSVREMLINEKYTGDALLQKTYSENHLTKKKIRNHGELTQYYAENTHPAIIDHETFERVQLERAARWASENVQNPTYARYLFSGRVVCGNCGAHYNRRTQTNGRGTPRRITWQCVTYSTKGKRACPAKQIPERTLMELTCEVLETGELTEETMNRLSEIRITGPNQVRFLFLDGRMVEKVWQDRSRAESWTDEMKQRASEQMKRRHRHE